MIDINEALELSSRSISAAGYRFQEFPRPAQVLYLIEMAQNKTISAGTMGWLVEAPNAAALGSTADAFDEIGAPRCAAIIRQILAQLVGTPLVDDPVGRGKVVLEVSDAVADVWRRLGDALLDWPDDVAGLLDEYVAQNQEVFADLAERAPPSTKGRRR